MDREDAAHRAAPCACPWFSDMTNPVSRFRTEWFTSAAEARRDVLAGMFHPSDPESAHATVAAAWLGPAAT